MLFFLYIFTFIPLFFASTRAFQITIQGPSTVSPLSSSTAQWTRQGEENIELQEVQIDASGGPSVVTSIDLDNGDSTGSFPVHFSTAGTFQVVVIQKDPSGISRTITNSNTVTANAGSVGSTTVTTTTTPRVITTTSAAAPAATTFPTTTVITTQTSDPDVAQTTSSTTTITSDTDTTFLPYSTFILPSSSSTSFYSLATFLSVGSSNPSFSTTITTSPSSTSSDSSDPSLETPQTVSPSSAGALDTGSPKRSHTVLAAVLTTLAVIALLASALALFLCRRRRRRVQIASPVPRKTFYFQDGTLIPFTSLPGPLTRLPPTRPRRPSQTLGGVLEPTNMRHESAITHTSVYSQDSFAPPRIPGPGTGMLARPESSLLPGYEYDFSGATPPVGFANEKGSKRVNRVGENGERQDFDRDRDSGASGSRDAVWDGSASTYSMPHEAPPAYHLVQGIH